MNLFRLGLTALLSSMTGRADVDPALIERAKLATALVVHTTSGEILGSAFCVDAAGYFVTDQSLDDRVSAHTLTLVLQPGSKKEHALSARVVRRDTQAGLALLRSDKPVAGALPLGDDVYLLETRTVVAIGNRFGMLLPRDMDPKVLRPILATTGRITSLHRSLDTVTQIRFDGRLYPGNTGGPLLDTEGRVVGVVTSRPPGTDQNSAAPAGILRAFLSEPLLQADFPETVPWSERRKPLRVEVAVHMLPAAVPPDTLTLSLDDGREERQVDLTKTDTGYAFEGPLLLPPSRVKLRLTLPGRKLACLAADGPLHGTESTHLLSELKAYTRSEGFLTRDGKTLPWAAGNDSLTVFLAGKPVQIPLQKINAFQLEPMDEARRIRYRLTALTNGVASTSLEGEVRFIDKPAHRVETPVAHADSGTTPILAPIQPIKAFSGAVETTVPAPITDLIPAGNGRFLLLRLDKIHQLAVFDVVALKVVTYLPLPEPTPLIAAGASSFVMVFPEKKIIQRIRLDTFECASTKTLSQPGIVGMVAMGYGSEGPLMVGMAEPDKPDPNDDLQLHFLDLQTFDPIKRIRNINRMHAGIKEGSARFSQDGRTLIVKPGLSGNYEVITLTETHVKTTARFSTIGYVVPGPNGVYFHTMKGLLALDMPMPAAAPSKGFATAVTPAESPVDVMTVPSTLPTYYLGAERRTANRHAPASIRLFLFVIGSSRPVVLLPETPELSETGQEDRLMIDQRVHYVPQAGILITVPPERNRLVARYIGIEALLKEADLDYLYVDSFPLHRIARGARYRYQIHVQTRDPRVTYTCDTCPEGMKAGANGLLAWTVPHDFPGSQVPVVLTIRCADGQELRHAFTIEILP